MEQFQQSIPQSRWTVSRATKQTPVGDEIFSYVGTFAIEEAEVYPGIKGDTGLVLSQSLPLLVKRRKAKLTERY